MEGGGSQVEAVRSRSGASLKVAAIALWSIASAVTKVEKEEEEEVLEGEGEEEEECIAL